MSPVGPLRSARGHGSELAVPVGPCAQSATPSCRASHAYSHAVSFHCE